MPDAGDYARYMVRGSTLVFLSQVLAGLSALLLRTFLARNLTIEEYGAFYAAFYFVSFFALFREMGLTTSLTKYTPEFLAERKYSLITASIRFVLLLQIVIVGSVSAVIFLLSPYIASGFIGSAGASATVRMLSIWLFVSIFYSTLLSVCQGFRNMGLYGFMNAGWDAFLLVFSVILISLFGFGVSGASLAYIIGTVAISALAFVYLLRTYRQVLSAPPAPLKSVSGEILKFSIPVFVGGIWSMIMDYIDTWAVTVFRGVKEVALYQVAQPSACLLFYFASAIVIPLFPMISELWARGERALLNRIIYFIVKFAFAAIMPFVLIFLAFPDVIIRVLFGQEYVSAAPVLQIFSIVVLSSLFYKIFGTVVVGIGKPKVTTVVSFVMCVASIALNLSLVPLIGMKGAALSVLLAHTIGFAIYAYYLKKSIDFSFPASLILRTVAGSLLTLLIITGLKSVLVLSVFVELFVVLAAGMIFYIFWIVVARIVTVEDLALIAGILPIPKKLTAWAGQCLRKLS